MEEIDRYRYLEDKLEESLTLLEEEFRQEGRKIISLINRKVKLSDNVFYKAYYGLVLRHERDYHEYVKKAELSNKAAQYKFKIEKRFYYYQRIYDRIKIFLQENIYQKINRNTLDQTLFYIDEINEKILKLLVIDLNSEFNNYYKILGELNYYSKKIMNKISIHLHIAYQENNFIRNIDYSKLDRISLKNMQMGDIIIFDEFEKYKSSLARRQIRFWVKTTILHSVIFMYKEGSSYVIYEAAGTNRKKSYLANLEVDAGVRYIVLRPRKSYNKKFREYVERDIKSLLNRRFSILKLYMIAFNYSLTKFYKTWFPYITAGRNLYFGKGIFCSETVAMLYGDLGLNISNNEDYGMVSPVDIYNSYNLDLVGYFDEESY